VSEPKRVALVTGTSSGIGEALALELLGRAWHVVGVSRRPAAIHGAAYAHLSVDLADLPAVAARIEAGAGALASGASRLALVNNAADVGLLGRLEQMNPAELLRVYAVNVAAPVWLMGWVVRRSGPATALRIVNVSSGAAVRALPGLGAYGSSKAALRMAGMVLASELDAGGPEGLRPDAGILSYEPGVVDTGMQRAARESPVERLPIVDAFVRFAAEGRLAPPSAPAREIADYLDGDGLPRFSERRYQG
jgi:benzil reductase ((S)-benzoin forming)